MTPIPHTLELTDDFVVIYAFGNENAPTSKMGQCILTLEAGGVARLENRLVGRLRSWTGTVDPKVLSRLIEALNASGFPVVPDHSIPPGPVRTIVVRTGAKEFSTYPTAFHEAKSMVGYRESYHLLDSIIMELSGRAIPVERNPETGLVIAAVPQA